MNKKAKEIKGGKKMKKRKVVSILLAAAMMTSLLATGCGAGGDEGGSSDGDSAKKITIFQQKTEIYDQLKDLAKAYEEETGVEVEVWQISGDDYYQN